MKIYGFKTSRHRKNLETFLSKIEINGIILDIGGAQKPIIGRISAKSKILRSYILDLPNPHTGSKNQIDFPTDIQEVNFEFLKYQNQYYAIFCLEVSLYWKDPKQAIANISKLMNDKTSLYVSFHQIYSPQKPNGKDFLRYSNDWIQEIFNDYDLEDQVDDYVWHGFLTGTDSIGETWRVEVEAVELGGGDYDWEVDWDTIEKQ